MDVSDPDQSGQIRLGELSLVSVGEVMDTTCHHSRAPHGYNLSSLQGSTWIQPVITPGVHMDTTCHHSRAPHSLTSKQDVTPESPS